MEPDIKDACNDLRAAILQTEKLVIHLKQHSVFTNNAANHPKVDFIKMKANIMLSYWHLGDARMRLGNVIQAYEDEVSIFDKKPGPVA